MSCNNPVGVTNPLQRTDTPPNLQIESPKMRKFSHTIFRKTFTEKNDSLQSDYKKKSVIAVWVWIKTGVLKIRIFSLLYPKAVSRIFPELNDFNAVSVMCSFYVYDICKLSKYMSFEAKYVNFSVLNVELYKTIKRHNCALFLCKGQHI